MVDCNRTEKLSLEARWKNYAGETNEMVENWERRHYTEELDEPALKMVKDSRKTQDPR